MIIPNKYSGYQAGVRLYPFGGGGSSEGSVPGMGDSQIGNTGGTTPIGTGVSIPAPVTPVVSVPGMGNSQIGNTGGTTPIGTGVSIPPPATSTVFVPGMGDSQIGNTGGTTPIGTGVNIPPLANVVAPPVTPPVAPPATPPVTPPVRPPVVPPVVPPVTSPFRPMGGADQFYQPVYQPQYQNFARPATQFDTSTYGTQPVMSPAVQSGMTRDAINNTIAGYFRDNPNAGMGQTIDAMRNAGINRTDIQAFGGFNNYGPQMSLPQLRTPFNPYTNSFQPQMGMGVQSPFRSSGPAQPIVSRSARARGTPNVMMRRAEGGIASLVDDE